MTVLSIGWAVIRMLTRVDRRLRANTLFIVVDILLI